MKMRYPAIAGVSAASIVFNSMEFSMINLAGFLLISLFLASSLKNLGGRL